MRQSRALRSVYTELVVLSFLLPVGGVPPATRAAQGTLPSGVSAEPLVAFRKNYNVYLMNADGSGQQPVTTRGTSFNGAYPSSDPVCTYPWFAWSPDGAYLLIVQDVFQEGQAPARDLLLLDVESLTLGRLIEGIAVNGYRPSWAVDGNEIAYITWVQDDGQSASYAVDRVDVTGRRTGRIDFVGPACNLPSGFNEDPALLLYFEEYGAPASGLLPSIQWRLTDEAALVGIACGGAELVEWETSAVQFLDINDPVLSSVGVVAGSTGSPLGTGEVVVTELAPDASVEKVGAGGVPVWSSDGQTLYFVQRIDQGESLILQPADGSVFTPLLLKRFTSAIWSANADGSEPEPLLEEDVYAYGLPSPTPDGRALVFSSIDNSTTLWENRLPNDTYDADLLERYSPHIRIQRLDLTTGEVTTLVEGAGRPAVQPLGRMNLGADGAGTPRTEDDDPGATESAETEQPTADTRATAPHP